jgi:hypothetical protein
MKECNAKAVGNEPASAVETLRQSPAERQYPAYIGLDVHKETIAVAVARAGREAPVSRHIVIHKCCWTQRRAYDTNVLLKR